LTFKMISTHVKREMYGIRDYCLKYSTFFVGDFSSHFKVLKAKCILVDRTSVNLPQSEMIKALLVGY